MLITPSFKKSLIVEQFQGNYLIKVAKARQLEEAPQVVEAPQASRNTHRLLLKFFCGCS